jgi:hypothetical protein
VFRIIQVADRGHTGYASAFDLRRAGVGIFLTERQQTTAAAATRNAIGPERRRFRF